MDLITRRNEIAAECLKVEKTRGSGWHAADLGEKDIPLTDRPIIMQDNDRIRIVEPDVTSIKDGINRFLTKLDNAKKKADERGWDAPDLTTYGVKFQANIVRQCKRFLEMVVPVDIHTQEWNYINSALQLVGISIVSASAEVQSYDDC